MPQQIVIQCHLKAWILSCNFQENNYPNIFRVYRKIQILDILNYGMSYYFTIYIFQLDPMIMIDSQEIYSQMGPIYVFVYLSDKGTILTMRMFVAVKVLNFIGPVTWSDELTGNWPRIMQFIIFIMGLKEEIRQFLVRIYLHKICEKMD